MIISFIAFQLQGILFLNVLTIALSFHVETLSIPHALEENVYSAAGGQGVLSVQSHYSVSSPPFPD